MNLNNPIVLASLGGLAVVAAAWIARHFFSAEARWARRRRRSNTRVASTAKRPMMKFNVHMKKD